LRRRSLLLPDLGSVEQNERLDALVADFARKLAKLMEEAK
jgi:hypothetical protein